MDVFIKIINSVPFSIIIYSIIAYCVIAYIYYKIMERKGLYTTDSIKEYHKRKRAERKTE